MHGEAKTFSRYQDWMAACVTVRQMRYGPRIFSSRPFGRKEAEKKFPGSMASLERALREATKSWGHRGFRDVLTWESWHPAEFKVTRHADELRFWYGCAQRHPDGSFSRWSVMGALVKGEWIIRRTRDHFEDQTTQELRA